MIRARWGKCNRLLLVVGMSIVVITHVSVILACYYAPLPTDISVDLSHVGLTTFEGASGLATHRLVSFCQLFASAKERGAVVLARLSVNGKGHREFTSTEEEVSPGSQQCTVTVEWGRRPYNGAVEVIAPSDKKRGQIAWVEIGILKAQSVDFVVDVCLLGGPMFLIVILYLVIGWIRLRQLHQDCLPSPWSAETHRASRLDNGGKRRK